MADTVESGGWLCYCQKGRSLMPFDSDISSDTSSGTVADVEVGTQTAHVSDDEVVEVAPIWLQRISLFVLVLFCVYLGVLVTILPWWTRIWDHNDFIQARPALSMVLHMGAVRGLISGVGLLDIWIGISEAIHYRDHRA
jgi:hypothetical protein